MLSNFKSARNSRVKSLHEKKETTWSPIKSDAEKLNSKHPIANHIKNHRSTKDDKLNEQETVSKSKEGEQEREGKGGKDLRYNENWARDNTGEKKSHPRCESTGRTKG